MLKLCRPMGTRQLPVGRNDDFGTSPFLGSFSDESMFACVNTREKIKNNRRHLLLCFGSPAELPDRPRKVDNFSGGHRMATIASSISRLVGSHLNPRLRKPHSFVGRLSPVPLQEFHVREARRQ
jgi:hypothetical protein